MKRLLGVLLISSLVSCGDTTEKESNQDEIINDSIEASTTEQEAVQNQEISFNDEVEFAQYCALQLNEGNTDALRPFTSGSVLLSPYAYIDKSTAREVTLDELEAASDKIHFWGIYDGRGDSILLTTPEYLSKYVSDFDINDRQVKIKFYSEKPNAYGNELHNVQKIYPDAKYVEFYFPPSEEGYMDWKALIFVVDAQDGKYSLKAVVHNQWTT